MSQTATYLDPGQFDQDVLPGAVQPDRALVVLERVAPPLQVLGAPNDGGGTGVVRR